MVEGCTSLVAIALHGGAGVIARHALTAEEEIKYRSSLGSALDEGYGILEKGGTALDAVEATVKSLEDCPLFNAGRGSVFCSDGTHEMDACIMDGSTLKAGSVAAISGVKNPIRLARIVMEQSPHVLLMGKGAVDFAREKMDVGDYDLPSDYFYTDYRYHQWQNMTRKDDVQMDHCHSEEQKFGTVGAVALDSYGNLAAATSTGGMTNKMYGRVGDSAVIGAGTYAKNGTCAVSCTGHGEYILRGVVAHDVSCLMEYKDFSLEEACHYVIHKKLRQLGGEGGLISVDRSGNISMQFNSVGMYRAARTSQGYRSIAMFECDDDVSCV